MTAYGNIDKAIAGLPFGLDHDYGDGVAAEAIAFGVPVFKYKGDSNSLYGFKQDVAKMVYSADFVTSNSVAVTIDGTALTATVFATDHLTTINAIITKINALTGCEAVLDATDTNNRTILVRKKGVASYTVTSTVTLGGSQATMSATYGSGQVFVGFSSFTQKLAGSYAIGDMVNIVREGGVWATVATSSKANGPVRITTAGVPTSSSSNTVELTECKFRTNESDTSGYAVVEVEGPQVMAYGDKF